MNKKEVIILGGTGSGRVPRKYNIQGLGQLTVKTIAKLLNERILVPKINDEVRKDWDALLVSEDNGKVILRGIKKIREIE